eukprot:1456679-Prymnesium_polylepis.2
MAHRTRARLPTGSIALRLVTLLVLARFPTVLLRILLTVSLHRMPTRHRTAHVAATTVTAVVSKVLHLHLPLLRKPVVALLQPVDLQDTVHEPRHGRRKRLGRLELENVGLALRVSRSEEPTDPRPIGRNVLVAVDAQHAQLPRHHSVALTRRVGAGRPLAQRSPTLGVVVAHHALRRLLPRNPQPAELRCVLGRALQLRKAQIVRTRRVPQLALFLGQRRRASVRQVPHQLAVLARRGSVTVLVLVVLDVKNHTIAQVEVHVLPTQAGAKAAIVCRNAALGTDQVSKPSA